MKVATWILSVCFNIFVKNKKCKKVLSKIWNIKIKITTKIWYLLEVKVFSKTFKVNFYVKAHQLGFYVKINLESFKGRASHIVGMYIQFKLSYLIEVWHTISEAKWSSLSLGLYHICTYVCKWSPVGVGPIKNKFRYLNCPRSGSRTIHDGFAF